MSMTMKDAKTEEMAAVWVYDLLRLHPSVGTVVSAKMSVTPDDKEVYLWVHNAISILGLYPEFDVNEIPLDNREAERLLQTLVTKKVHTPLSLHD